MDYSEIIISQYQAALEMLKQTIAECPEASWSSPDDKTQFWQIAYHALFYTHLYLQDSVQAFRPWSKHRKDYQNIGQLPGPLSSPPQIGEPYAKGDVLEYLAVCQHQVKERVPHLNLEAASGFDWLSFSKLELQFYTIRHIQQHVGELIERLGTRAGAEIDWVVMKPG